MTESAGPKPGTGSTRGRVSRAVGYDWRMELFTAATSAVGAVAGLVAAVGVLIVNAKLDRLTGRVDEQGDTLRSHVNAAGLHRTA